MNHSHELSVLGLLITIYATLAMCSVIFLLVAGDEFIQFPEDLRVEGRFVFVVGLAVLWPAVALGGAIWALFFLARGVAQVVRFIVPRRISGPPKIPKAQVRR